MIGYVSSANDKLTLYFLPTLRKKGRNSNLKSMNGLEAMMEQSTYWPYWGKAGKEMAGEGASCHLLVYHSLDVAAVGYEYLARSETFDKLLSVYFPGNDK
ncbi:MAG: hypothetical protein LBB55_02880, partial [Zoogloeaceae bacterium]|nr:hypothetical protein [Zoogloeaceae bacterium]